MIGLGSLVVIAWCRGLKKVNWGQEVFRGALVFWSILKEGGVGGSGEVTPC